MLLGVLDCCSVLVVVVGGAELSHVVSGSGEKRGANGSVGNAVNLCPVVDQARLAPPHFHGREAAHIGVLLFRQGAGPLGNPGSTTAQQSTRRGRVRKRVTLCPHPRLLAASIARERSIAHDLTRVVMHLHRSVPNPVVLP